MKTKLCTNTMQDEQGIDKAVEDLTNCLISSYHIACPERKMMGSKKVPWWSHALTKLRKKARKAYRYRKQDNYYAEQYKELHSLYKKEVRKAKRASWYEYCENIRSVPEAARLQKIIKKDSNTKLGMLKKKDNTYTRDPEEMLQVLLDTHFPECIRINEDVISTVTVIPVMEKNPDWGCAESIVQQHKVSWAIDDLEPYKAAGTDGIFPALLQQAQECIVSTLTRILKACVAYKYIPKVWRLVKVIFLPKPGKDNYEAAKSFRPISLTSYLLKILEKLICRFLWETILKEEPLHRWQYAYQEGKSTVAALQRFVDKIEYTLEDKGFALAVFMDIEGAFDSVPFGAITAAMQKRNIPSSISNLIDTMLRNRVMLAHSNDTEKRALAGRGCPQGGVLSPLLWNLVVDELLKEFERNSAFAFAYADDVTSLSSGSELDIVTINMQKNLNLMEVWCKETGLKVNPSKTTVVLFTRNRVKKVGNLRIFGEELKYSSSVKLLGVTLDSKLNWNEHCKIVCNKATSALMQCRRAVGKTWGLSPKVMMWIYTLIIRPIFSYSALLWWHRMEVGCIVTKLIQVQRLAALCITGAQHSCSTAALEAFLCLPPLDIYLRGQALMWMKRLKKNNTWSNRSSRGHTKLCVGPFAPAILDVPTDEGTSKFFFTKHFSTKIESGNADHTAPFDIECYTDGSCKGNRYGTGVYCQQIGYSAYWCLGQLCSVFQAELYGILKATRMLIDLNLSGVSIGLFTDSQASIKALDKVKVKSGLVQQCIEALNELGALNTLSIVWIKGHNNCLGNEWSTQLP